jgi:hypothetical protein
MTDLRLVLFVVIVTVFCFSLISIIFSVTRRVNNKRRYEKLDRLREKFRPAISAIITSGSLGAIHRFINKSKIRAGSIEWVALEHVLFELSEKEGQKNYGLKLFEVFDYTHYYHNQLSLRNSSIALCTAADKLGRIGDASAVDPLSILLNHKNSEVVTVAFRALCRIGTNNALQHVLVMLPTLLKNGRVTVKVIQTSLLLFGSWAGDMLLQYARTNDIPEVRAVILETLVAFPPRREITEFALAMLSHPDPEVRGKALKVIARVGLKYFSYDSGVFLKLLDDHAWFVRLQAAKTIGKVKCENYLDMLKQLALDERWQVRDAATLALAELGDESLDAFLELLETPDRYAKESISEEIQRTGFVFNLIEHLNGSCVNLERKAKAERILSSMHSVGFSTPLRELLETGKSHPDITAGLKKILFAEASS